VHRRDCPRAWALAGKDVTVSAPRPKVPSLGDPDCFVDGAPHEWLGELRRTTPVVWQTLEDGSGFFAVLTHADVIRVARNPTLFSAREGGVILEDSSPESLEMSRD